MKPSPPGIWPWFACVLALVQWPLAATVSDGWVPASLLTAGLLTAGSAAWLSAAVLEKARKVSILTGSLLLTLGAYVGLRHTPLTQMLVIATGLWFSATIVLLGDRSPAARAALAVAAFFLAGLVLELFAGLLPVLGPPDRADSQIGRAVFSGRVEAPDLEAERQLLPLGRAVHRKYGLDGELVFHVEYRTDRFGSREVPKRPDSGRDWYLFGDSFTFGEGVGDGETIAARLQELHPEARVFNFGMRGAGPTDAWIHLARRLKSGETPAWAFYLFIYDHFRRAAVPPLTVATEGARPRAIVANGRPRLLGKADETIPSIWQGLHVNLLARSKVYRALTGGWIPDESAIALVTELASAMHGEVRGRGPHDKFAVVFLPTQTQPWTDQVRTLKLRLRDRGVPVIDCDDPVREANRLTGSSWEDLFLADGHPTARYTALAAQCMSSGLPSQDGGL